MPCSPCRCKLSIVGLVLSSLCSAIQVAVIYMNEHADKFDSGVFVIISFCLNVALTFIHSFQIGLKSSELKSANNSTEQSKKDVESSIIEVTAVKKTTS